MICLQCWRTSRRCTRARSWSTTATNCADVQRRAIQGMAAVALGRHYRGLACVTDKRLRDQQIVFLGARSAAVGGAGDYLRAVLVQDGLAEVEARADSGW